MVILKVSVETMKHHVYLVIVSHVCHRGSCYKAKNVQNGMWCRHFTLNQQTKHTENIKLPEGRGEQMFIFLTQSMALLRKLLQGLRARKPRTSKEMDFDIRETTLLYKELSK